MAVQKKPKVLLFDMGGVCVKSPFQAILDYELGKGIPPGWVNYSISRTSPNGFWHQLERGEIPLDKAFYDGFSQDLHHAGRWRDFYNRERSRNPSLPQEIPPIPSIDAQWLFEEMMRSSKGPDPWMFPALQNLKKSDGFILAALSNTIIFPPGHELYIKDFSSDPLRSLFDVFVSSAHIGLRKPDPKVYQFAVAELDKFAKANAGSSRGQRLNWTEGVQPGDIVFLDDIGENLKAARLQGFGTIKVNLGKAFEAVDELERLTGLELAGDHPRIPVQPNRTGSKAKL
ncbi:HAD-like domain-containing protein [Mariannaea sp. PMI_226]|nr:HAD-like domain-containing protein [Mariannaea sp. PMI_226]